MYLKGVVETQNLSYNVSEKANAAIMCLLCVYNVSIICLSSRPDLAIVEYEIARQIIQIMEYFPNSKAKWNYWLIFVFTFGST